MSTPIENRALWNAYGEAKERATKAGADPQCAQRIAMAAVKAPGDVDQVPDLCGRCKRLGLNREAA